MPPRKQQNYTLADIREERDALAAKAREQEARISAHWDEMMTPPTVESQFRLWANRAEAAFTLYDGFMTGFKLLRSYGDLLGSRKKRARKSRVSGQ